MRQFRRGGPKPPSEPGGAAGGVGTLTAPGPDGPPPESGRSRRRYDPAWDEWQRPRRWPGILLSCAIVLGFLGVIVWHYRPHAKPRSAPVVIKHSEIKNLKTTYVMAGHGVRTTTFHGTTNKSRLTFTSNGKLLVLHARCDCAYNFVVTVSNALGLPVAFPVSNTGYSNVTLNQTLPAGRYQMQVIASGPWQLQLIQPTAAAAVLKTEPSAFKFLSIGPSVLGPFSSANRFLYLRYAPGAAGAIRVYVLDPAGTRVDTVFSSRYIIQQGATLPNPSNPYFIEVDASSGLWQLSVQHTRRT